MLVKCNPTEQEHDLLMQNNKKLQDNTIFVGAIITMETVSLQFFPKDNTLRSF